MFDPVHGIWVLSHIDSVKAKIRRCPALSVFTANTQNMVDEGSAMHAHVINIIQ